MTTSIYSRTDGLKTDDELHSPIIDGYTLVGTPAYADSVSRLQSLGLTKEEAEALLKE